MFTKYQKCFISTSNFACVTLLRNDQVHYTLILMLALISRRMPKYDSVTHQPSSCNSNNRQKNCKGPLSDSLTSNVPLRMQIAHLELNPNAKKKIESVHRCAARRLSNTKPASSSLVGSRKSSL